MPLNSSGPISLAGTTVGVSIQKELGGTGTTQISLNDAAVRSLAGIASGAITMPTNFWGKGAFTPTQKGIFGYGLISSGYPATLTFYNIANLVSNTGVVSANTTGVGTARCSLAACGYGGDKGIFGYGTIAPNATTNVSMTNKVANTGVVSGDTAGVGTARQILASCGYGGDKGIFGYGYTTTNVSMTNLVSNTGVVSGDTTGVGTARYALAACGYGGDKGIFGYGYIFGGATRLSMTNLVSNTGVVSGDTAGVGTARAEPAACGYGGDKGIFGYGYTGSVYVSVTNLVSNTGVVSGDTAGVGSVRGSLAACGYGGDKGIFGYGSGPTSVTNLVSNTGVVSANTTGVGTARYSLAACGYSFT